ncbi:MAG: WxL domain-containing protein [Enterococcaceae bacterium]|nr:WxL domain-containing protein [Enterococcaceae bacterium]
MKKFVFLTAAATLATMAITTTQAFADQTGGVYTTDGVIEFTPSKKRAETVDPQDPSRPVKPIDPENPTKPITPGTQGPLSIDFASNFYFGKQEITSETKTYNAAAQKYLDSAGKEQTGPNFVQVSDNRGTETGWKLLLKQEKQFTSTNGKELIGAQVSLENGRVVTNSKSKAPAGETAITVAVGADQKVMNAKTGSGAGTYLLDWGNDEKDGATSVHLTVPGSTTKYAEKYSTTFTWKLTDAPDNK